ncbi:hypothetical protein MW887_004031 [Aspergillus wentii]|nr:hypothetical protein MW887_004031 [Aspergillus wentii]
MDKLVAQYSRRPHQNEFYSEQEQHDLTESHPSISLKFNLPPVDNVSLKSTGCGGCGCSASWRTMLRSPDVDNTKSTVREYKTADHRF